MPEYDLGTARGKIELDASSLGRASAAFASLGKGMLGFGAVAVGAFAYVAKSAADFEKILSGVKAVTGATGDQMDILREKALTLGSQSIFSADQIAGAFEDLGKAGISVDEIIGGAADAVVHLAHAAGDELPGGITQGAEIIANAMKTFEVGADQAEHFADVLVAAAASSTTSVDDLAVSMRYAGPIAHELGLSIDDLGSVLAILGDRGIKGSTAGTSLRGVLLSLTGTSGPAREALRDLGIITEDGTNKFYDMNGALKPIPEVMQILQDATKGLTEEQKIQTFNTIFQRRAMNAALIMAEQGAAGFDAYSQSIAGLSAADIAATKLDNLSGDMTILKNSIHSLIIRAGEPLQQMLRGWVQGLTGVITWLSNLDPKILALIVKGLAIVGVFAAVSGSGLLMVSMLIKAYKTYKELVEGIKLVISFTKLMSATLLTSPWFWLVAALVAVGVAMYQLYQRSESFRNFIDGIGNTIKDFILPVINELRDGWLFLVDAFNSGETSGAGGIIGFMERIGVAARAVADFFNGSLMDGIEAFWNALRGEGVTSDGFIGLMERMGVLARELAGWIADLADGFSRFWTVLTTGFTQDEGGTWFEDLAFHIRDVAKWLLWLGKEVIERVVSGFDWFKSNIWPTLFAFGELVAAVVGHVIDLFSQLGPEVRFLAKIFKLAFDNIMTVVGFAVRLIQRIWGLFGDNLWQSIQIVFGFIKNTIESVMRVIQGIIQTVTSLIKGDWSGAWEGIKNIFGGVWDYIAYLPGFILDSIRLVIETALDAIHAIFSTAWDLIKTVFSMAWDNLKTIVIEGVGYIIDFIASIPGKLEAFTGHLFDGLIEAAGGAVEAVVGFFADLPGRIGSWVSSVATKALEIGGAIRDGIVNGLTGIISGLGDIATQIKDTIWEAIKTLINTGIDAINSMIPNEIGGWDIPGPGPDFPSINLPDDPIPHLHSGGEFRTSRGEGLAMLRDKEVVFTPEQMEKLRAALQAVSGVVGQAMAVRAQTQVPMMLSGSGGTGDTSVNVDFVFPNVGSAKDAQEIKAVISEGALLTKLTQAIKAGVGRNN